jgi:hypothetical protein
MNPARTRGDILSQVDFFAASLASLNRKSHGTTCRIQQPVFQKPECVVSQLLPSGLAPGGQVSRPNSNEGSRQWVGTTWPLAQRCRSTQHSVLSLSLPNRQSSKGEDMPSPPLPPDAAPTKEEFLSSILCPGRSSCTGIVGTHHPPLPTVLRATII